MIKTSVTKEDVEANMQDIQVNTIHAFRKPCTIVFVRMKNGFVLTEQSICVDPNNYSEEIGKEICLSRIENEVWKLLGYELQTKLHDSVDTSPGFAINTNIDVIKRP